MTQQAIKEYYQDQLEIQELFKELKLNGQAELVDDSRLGTCWTQGAYDKCGNYYLLTWPSYYSVCTSDDAPQDFQLWADWDHPAQIRYMDL